MWFDQVYAEEQKKKVETKNVECKQKFEKTYPEIPFERLVKQSNHTHTDDSSTHYLDTLTMEIYSFHYYKGDWYQPSNQASLMDMFPKQTKDVEKEVNNVERENENMNKKPELEPKLEQEPEPNKKLVDMRVHSQQDALQLIAHFLSLAQKRGSFTIDESAKIWECLQQFA